MRCEKCGEHKTHEYSNGHSMVVVDLVCWRRDLLEYLCSDCHAKRLAGLRSSKYVFIAPYLRAR